MKDFTLAELKAMDIGSRVGKEWADERIPTFDEFRHRARERWAFTWTSNMRMSRRRWG